MTAGELPPEDGRDVFPLGDFQHLPSIEIEVGGRALEVVLDTGSGSGLSLPDSMRSSLKFRAPAAVVGKRLTIDGTCTLEEARLDGTVLWGRHRLENPVVGFTGGHRAIAGVGVLREFRTTFDFSNSRVRFERRGAEPIRSKPVRGLGAALVPATGDWIVTDVLDDGPAAKAGIRVGDRVASIDDKSVSDLSQKALRELLDAQDSARLRIVGADGTREVVVPVVTFVE